MEIVKAALTGFIIILQAVSTSAQTDGALQKAFNDSYTQESSKKYAEAIATLIKVYDEKSYEINLRIGWLHYSNKSYTQSQNYYQKAVNLKPYAIEAKLGLIKPLAALESWDKVLQQYEDILKIDPQNTTALYWSGIIWYNRKKYETAAKLFEKVVNLYPLDYDANHMLAWSYLNMGRNNDARILFTKALLTKPQDASSLSGLSKIK
jgi:tetratricopeptide (TPR) repeat protein